MPTAAQEQQILSTWGSVVPKPAFDYAYSWGSQSGDTSLSNDAALQQAFATHNALGAGSGGTGSGGTGSGGSTGGTGGTGTGGTGTGGTGTGGTGGTGTGGTAPDLVGAQVVRDRAPPRVTAITIITRDPSAAPQATRAAPAGRAAARRQVAAQGQVGAPVRAAAAAVPDQARTPRPAADITTTMTC